jgi:hypothetical protein
MPGIFLDITWHKEANEARETLADDMSRRLEND